MTIKIDNHQHHTLEKIFSHPLARDLHWVAVEHLLDDLGERGETHTGNLTFSVDGTLRVVHGKRGRELSADQVIELRHILHDFGFTPDLTGRG
jgi:hypothetical protein